MYSWCRATGTIGRGSPRFRSIVEPVGASAVQERKFTEPPGASYQMGYGDLLTILERATRADDIAEQIHAELTA